MVVPVLEQLAAAPARLAAVTGPRVDVRPAPDVWSAAEVLAHLRACGHVWGGCIRRIVAQDVPTIRAVNPRTWMEASELASQGWSEHLAAFAADRTALLEVLRGLSPADWERSARVVGAGRPMVRTVLSYTERLAVHERAHLRQVERAVGRA